MINFNIQIKTYPYDHGSFLVVVDCGKYLAEARILTTTEQGAREINKELLIQAKNRTLDLFAKLIDDEKKALASQNEVAEKLKEISL